MLKVKRKITGIYYPSLEGNQPSHLVMVHGISTDYWLVEVIDSFSDLIGEFLLVHPNNLDGVA